MSHYSYPDDIRLDMAANPLPNLPPMALQAPSIAHDPDMPATRFERRPERG